MKVEAVLWRRGLSPQGREAQRRQVAHALIAGGNGRTLCGLRDEGLINLPVGSRPCQRCESAMNRVVPW